MAIAPIPNPRCHSVHISQQCRSTINQLLPSHTTYKRSSLLNSTSANKCLPTHVVAAYIFTTVKTKRQDKSFSIILLFTWAEKAANVISCPIAFQKNVWNCLRLNPTFAFNIDKSCGVALVCALPQKLGETSKTYKLPDLRSVLIIPFPVYTLKWQNIKTQIIYSVL